MASVTGVGDINGYIAQLMSLERSSGPLALYETDRQELTLRSASLTDLRSNLSALNAQAQSLMQPGTLSPFQAKAVTSSNTAVATATPTASALAASHSLFVTQLARPDTLTTKSFADDGTDLVTTEGAGTKTIRITVDATDSDIDVVLSAGQSNKTILTNMAEAINAHATASTLVTAAVIQVDSTSSKLVLTSKQTGLSHVLTLTDQTGTLFGTTDLRDAAAADEGANRGGYLYADTALDAKFTLDGLTLSRSGNTVTDAIPGVTLNFLGTQAPGATPVTLTVGADQVAIKAKVQGFLDSYNTLVKFLKERTGTTVTATTSATGATTVGTINRGVLDAEPAYLNLLINLRGDVGGRISTAASGGPASLAEIGITAASDGSLSISDTTVFESALGNPGSVATLWNSSDGIASRVTSRLAGFVNTGGVVDGSLAAVTSRLTSVNTVIQQQEALLKVKEEALRQQLMGLQKVLTQLQLQQAAIDSASASGIFG